MLGCFLLAEILPISNAIHIKKCYNNTILILIIKSRKDIFMKSFQELYLRLKNAAIENTLASELEIINQEDYDSHHLDCLLNPKKHAVVLRTGDCDCDDSKKDACTAKCFFKALYKDESGNVSINPELCVGCSCIHTLTSQINADFALFNKKSI